jgi:hypothetical protein
MSDYSAMEREVDRYFGISETGRLLDDDLAARPDPKTMTTEAIEAEIAEFTAEIDRLDFISTTSVDHDVDEY